MKQKPIHSLCVASIVIAALLLQPFCWAQRGALQPTSVPGAYYYWDNTDGYVGLSVSNTTSSTVTFFWYWADSQGNLTFDDLVADGATVFARSVPPLSETYLGDLSPKRFWVWAKKGRWLIKNGAVVRQSNNN